MDGMGMVIAGVLALGSLVVGLIAVFSDPEG